MEYIDYSAGGYSDVMEEMVQQQHGAHQAQAQSQQYGQSASSALPDGTGSAFYHQNLPPPAACDAKPRLTKDQHDYLESHYQKQQKPNTNTKKGFAEHLGVSLDKVNNWFQNRRAKAKQDAKKAQGAHSIMQAYQPVHFSSDSEPSPFEPSGQYATMMQQFTADGLPSAGLGISHIQQLQPSNEDLMQMYASQGMATQPVDDYSWQAQLPDDYYDTTSDYNRRTLTQENFMDMHRNGGMVNAQGQFEGLQAGFSDNNDLLAQVFGDVAQHDTKQNIDFPYPVGAPLSSSDSTVPSIMSESYNFPINNTMRPHEDSSATESDWADSRSSSLSMQHPENAAVNGSAMQTQPPVTVTQWQPGQSVPVDVNEQYEEFRQIAQSRAAEQQSFEQPLAFPTDGAFARRTSHQTSMLAQSLGNVNIQTPHLNQPEVFKSPAPPTTIAARRQRPKPANLGIAALRSASYSAPGQPGSPGPGSVQSHLPQDQQLRRIRSAAVVANGGVAHGRIMKSTPGSAQRSPVNWNFAHSMVSPHLIRNISQDYLAPPTPMSPHDFVPPEHTQNGIQSQAGGYPAQQPTISEVEYQQNIGRPAYEPSASVPAQKFTSPPRTPSFSDHSFAPRRVGSNVITENTPPQSAPAGQSCFPSNIWAKPQQPVYQHVPQMQTPSLSLMQSYQAPQPQHHVQPEQQVQGPTVIFARGQQSNVTTGPPPGIPLQFANGVPTVTAEGTVKMAFPPQAQLMQQQSQQMGTPPQQHYHFGPNNGSPSGMYAATQPRGELFVHEYSPPDGIKRASIPRRPVETAPKSYAFTNHGPADFEGKKSKKSSDARESSTSCSPASSTETSSTA